MGVGGSPTYRPESRILARGVVQRLALFCRVVLEAGLRCVNLIGFDAAMDRAAREEQEQHSRAATPKQRGHSGFPPIG